MDTQHEQPTQIKKTPNEPDVANLNPEIVRLARRNTLIRQPMIMFMHGQLTWMEALEMMVTLVGNEYTAQKKLLIETMQEVGPMRSMNIPMGSPLQKAIPTEPLPLCLANDSKT